jgi:DnaK suppressor protein
VEKFDSTLTERFAELLAQRDAQARAVLRDTGEDFDVEGKTLPRDVTDFKDVADGASQAAVDDAIAEHAIRELKSVAAARRRLTLGSYGYCENCHKAIDLRRLQAIPEAALCAACQSAGELNRSSPKNN